MYKREPFRVVAGIHFAELSSSVGSALGHGGRRELSGPVPERPPHGGERTGSGEIDDPDNPGLAWGRARQDRVRGAGPRPPGPFRLGEATRLEGTRIVFLRLILQLLLIN